MTGLEYMRTVCPTTKVGKEPLREDVVDAFEDGIAEGWKQCREKQWKPSEEQLDALKVAIAYMCDESETPTAPKVLEGLLEQLKEL